MPILRWAGSKRQLLTKLTAYWSSDYNRYIEPFVGSGALFFSLKPHKAILGDLNSHLINTYREVKKSPVTVCSAAHGLRKGKHAYYALRKQDPADLEPLARAARFVFLNRFCFNGLYRTNHSGRFNVPYAPARTGNLPAVEQFIEASEGLSKARLVSGDFQKVLSLARKGDFVYLDPPYVVASRRVFSAYGAKEFTHHDLARLSKELRRLDKIGVKFVVSYADCVEARQLFGTWDMRRVRIRRNIAGFTGHRRRAFEVIISNAQVIGLEK
jgi:DNA adenine methylase